MLRVRGKEEESSDDEKEEDEDEDGDGADDVGTVGADVTADVVSASFELAK